MSHQITPSDYFRWSSLVEEVKARFIRQGYSPEDAEARMIAYMRMHHKTAAIIRPGLTLTPCEPPKTPKPRRRARVKKKKTARSSPLRTSSSFFRDGMRREVNTREPTPQRTL